MKLGQSSGGRITLDARTRATHMQVIGASGTGKSKFLEHLLRQDIINRQGLCLIDPTGNLYRDLVHWAVPKGLLERGRILLFDPGQDDWTFGFNPLTFGDVPTHDLALYVEAVVAAIAQVWGGEDLNRTPLLKKCLRAVLYVLAEKRLTLVEAVHLLMPEEVALRKHLTVDLHDEAMRLLWGNFNAMSAREFREQFGSVENRLMEFLFSPRIRAILGQQERLLDTRALMDQGQVLLVNLSSGHRLSAANASLLGTLLVNDIFIKALGRQRGSRPFYLYIDECPRFLTDDVRRALDEGRQFGLHLILAHQHLSQLQAAGEAICGAVMTDARTKVVFGGLAPDDAEEMARHLYMSELDLEEAKHSLDKPYVTGQHKEWLRGDSHTVTRSHSHTQSSTWSDSEGESHTVQQGWSSGRSKNAGQSGHFMQMLPDWSESAGSSRQDSGSSSTGSSRSHSQGGSEAHSYSSGESHGHSRREAYVSDYAVGPSQVYSLEEQRHRKAALLRDLRRQQAVVKRPEHPAVQIRVPDIKPPYARAERLHTAQTESFGCSPFASRRDEVEDLLYARQTALQQRVAQGLPPAPALPADSAGLPGLPEPDDWSG